MDEGKEILGFLLSNWKTLVRWVLRIPAQPEITVDELKDQLEMDNPPVLVDVRSQEEYNGTDETYKYGHIPEAILVPMLEMENRLNELEQYKDREIVTMCPGGGMSLVAVEVLNEAGFNKVKSLKGGTDAWHKKGYPMVKGTDAPN
jgi:rhodanese-related sulfurtransferase